MFIWPKLPRAKILAAITKKPGRPSILAFTFSKNVFVRNDIGRKNSLIKTEIFSTGAFKTTRFINKAFFAV